jgi:hypothetical protein
MPPFLSAASQQLMTHLIIASTDSAQPSSHGGISSMLLEVLHLALVLLRFFKSGKCTEVAPLACRIALFSGVQAIFAGF